MTLEEYKRGQHIISPNEAVERAVRLLPLDDFGLTWGGLVLPSTEATTHFCVVGATGSGKTTLLRLLMQSALPLIGAKYKEKSYEVEHEEKEPLPTQEWLAYLRKVEENKEEAAQNQARLQENQRQTEAIRIENETIRQKNEAISREKGKLEQELSSLTSDAGSIPNLKRWIIAIPGTFFGLLSLGAGHMTIGFAAFATLLPTAVVLTKLFNKASANFSLSQDKSRLTEKIKLLVPLQEKPVPPVFDLTETRTIPPPVAGTRHTKERVEPKTYSGEGHRALIYDAKVDILSLLHGMGLKCPIEILNPFDVRATAWDIAKDVTSPVTARQFATVLIPEDKNASQPFFANAARDIIGQVLLTLIQIKPGEWTLRDLLLAVQSKKYLIELLNQTPQGKLKAETYLSEERTGLNILSEIATRMAPFEAVAQAWNNCPRQISLTQWVESEAVLVLGNNEEHRAALDPINRVLFQRATELVLAQSESTTRRTWFFLDEVRDAGNLESLGRLMTKGRSKGACVALGFQDIEGMHDAFGKERANEFIGQCANKAILRLNSPETAKWASELFGKYEFMEEEAGENKGGSKTSGVTKTTGETTGDTTTSGTTMGSTTGTSTGVSHSEGTNKGGGDSFGINTSSRSSQWGSQKGKQTSEQTTEQTSKQDSESVAKQTSTQTSTADNTSDTESWTQTINKKRMEKDALLPSEFTTLPVTNPRNGLHGYYLVPSVGAFYGVLEGSYIKGALLERNVHQANYVPRPDAEQYLQAWDLEELRALGLQEFMPEDMPSEPNNVTAKNASDTGKNAKNDTDDRSKKRQPPRNSRPWLPGTDRDNGLTRI